MAVCNGGAMVGRIVDGVGQIVDEGTIGLGNCGSNLCLDGKWVKMKGLDKTTWAIIRKGCS